MSYRYAGHPGLVALPAVREYDPKEGWVYTQRYQGPVAAINGFAQILISERLRFRIIESDSAFATLEISADEALDGEDEETKELELNIVWDMPGNRLEKDLFTLPGIAADQSATVTTVNEMKVQLDLLAKGETNLTLIPPDYFGTAIAYQVFLLKAVGVDSYQLSQFSVKRSITLPESYSQRWSLANNNRQFTTAQLKTEYKAEENLKVTLPAGAWLMQSTTSAQQPNGKVVITEEWWHADTWNTYLYPARIAEEVVT